VLQTVDAGGDPAGRDEHVDGAVRVLEGREVLVVAVADAEADAEPRLLDAGAQLIDDAVDVVRVDERLLTADEVRDDRRQTDAGENLLERERGLAADLADLVEVGAAVDLRAPALVELHGVVGLPAGAEGDEALVEVHAVLHGGPGVDLVVPVALDHLDEALALLQGVDHRGAGHAEDAELGALLGRLEHERLDQALALAHVRDVALLREVDLVDDDEVDDRAFEERDELRLGVRLLELLEVHHQVARRAGERVVPLG
jgi:hypothetical protein